VFDSEPGGDDVVCFRPAAELTPDALAAIAGQVRVRVLRWFAEACEHYPIIREVEAPVEPGGRDIGDRRCHRSNRNRPWSYLQPRAPLNVG
jgi:hypothetical protein